MSHCKSSVPYQELDTFISSFAEPQKELLRILLQAQTIFGYLSDEVLSYIASKLNLPLTDIAQVVSFYSYLSTKPKGLYNIAVCLGSLCNRRGGQSVLDCLKQELGIEIGETTSDGLFSLSLLRCVGACGQAPILQINGEIYPKVTPQQIPVLLSEYRQKGLFCNSPFF